MLCVKQSHSIWRMISDFLIRPLLMQTLRHAWCITILQSWLTDCIYSPAADSKLYYRNAVFWSRRKSIHIRSLYHIVTCDGSWYSQKRQSPSAETKIRSLITIDPIFLSDTKSVLLSHHAGACRFLGNSGNTCSLHILRSSSMNGHDMTGSGSPCT